MSNSISNLFGLVSKLERDMMQQESGTGSKLNPPPYFKALLSSLRHYHPAEKKFRMSTLSMPLIILYTSVKSLLNLRRSSENNPGDRGLFLALVLRLYLMHFRSWVHPVF